MKGLRAVFFAGGLVTLTLLLGVAGLPFLLAPRRPAAWFGKFWSGAVLAWLRFSAGISYRVIGWENLPPGPAILALKHQSALETLALHQIFRDPAIVCKKELLNIPVFGWYLKRSGVIAIDRTVGTTSVKAMISAGKQALGEGRHIAVFPEGTRVPAGSKRPYQPGAGILYSQLGVPMVPIALNTGLFWGKSLLDKKPGRAIVEILPPIQPGLPRRDAMELLENKIENATQRLISYQILNPPVDKLVDNASQQFR